MGLKQMFDSVIMQDESAAMEDVTIITNISKKISYSILNFDIQIVT